MFHNLLGSVFLFIPDFVWKVQYKVVRLQLIFINYEYPGKIKH